MPPSPILVKTHIRVSWLRRAKKSVKILLTSLGFVIVFFSELKSSEVYVLNHNKNFFFGYIIKNFVKIQLQNYRQEKGQVSDITVTKNFYNYVEIYKPWGLDTPGL